MWCRSNLKWADSQIVNFVAYWGAAVTLGSAVLHPILLKRLSAFKYSTLGNIAVWSGLTIHGLAPEGIGMWGGVPIILPGVNGGAAHAISALALAHGRNEGYGNGEMSAWGTNGRTLMQSMTTMLIGFWYGRCSERGIYPGTAWWLLGIIAGGIPQLIILSMGPSSFDVPNTLPESN